MKVYPLNDSNFDMFISINSIVVVDFNADWCAPCKRMAPIFESYANEFPNIVFASLDIDIAPQTVRRYGIRGIPFFLLFRNGEPADHVIGADPRSLRRMLEIL